MDGEPAEVMVGDGLPDRQERVAAQWVVRAILIAWVIVNTITIAAR